MITVQDFTFFPHHYGNGGKKTAHEFPNRIRVSITTNTCHTDSDDTYEMMVMSAQEVPGHPTGEDGIYIRQTAEKLNKILAAIQEMPHD